MMSRLYTNASIPSRVAFFQILLEIYEECESDRESV